MLWGSAAEKCTCDGCGAVLQKPYSSAAVRVEGQLQKHCSSAAGCVEAQLPRGAQAMAAVPRPQSDIQEKAVVPPMPIRDQSWKAAEALKWTHCMFWASAAKQRPGDGCGAPATKG